MEKRIGPGDISYCSTNCPNQYCKRNLKYWKAPTQLYSVSNLGEHCIEKFNKDCKYMWLTEIHDKKYD